MNILFLHSNFPAQFRHLAKALAQDSQNNVVFGTATENNNHILGVKKVVYQSTREVSLQTHAYVRSLEQATLVGQAAFRMAQDLQANGFVPDIIFGHSGWGATLFMKDLFPRAQFYGYFEWFYRAYGSDADFDVSVPQNFNQQAQLRLRNTPILTDLYSCDRGLSPTRWQRQQFPVEFQSKISVLHDGVDTDYFQPKVEAKLVLPSLGLDLSGAEEIVTYVARGMEPYRGFPQFIEMVAKLQKRRPNCHFVVVGEDRVAYGHRREDDKTYKEWMLDVTPLDLTRVHFTGPLPYGEYRQVLQASSVHVYLTYPFVLSWSMLEAMSTGCAIVGSNTAPVQEVIQDGKNGLLIDFFSVDAIADRVEEVLKNRQLRQELGQKARQTILKHYSLSKLLPQQINWLTNTVDKQKAFVVNNVSQPAGFKNGLRRIRKSRKKSSQLER